MRFCFLLTCGALFDCRIARATVNKHAHLSPEYLWLSCSFVINGDEDESIRNRKRWRVRFAKLLDTRSNLKMTATGCPRLVHWCLCPLLMSMLHAVLILWFCTLVGGRRSTCWVWVLVIVSTASSKISVELWLTLEAHFARLGTAAESKMKGLLLWYRNLQFG